MSMSVASSWLLLDLADAGSGTCEAQVAQAATSDPFKKDLLDISFGMITPVSVVNNRRTSQHGKHCSTAEPTGNALAVAVQYLKGLFHSMRDEPPRFF
jgi:hypothetical protein